MTIALPDARGPLDFPDSPLSRALRQPLMLGVFLNLQDIRHSAVPTGNSWDFDYNLRIVQQAEALGFDMAFSRTQWLPKGGYDGDASLDAFVALGAMAAATREIILISTMHVLYGPLHPLHIAKYGATLDHIAKGRWGINVVTGHRAVEHEMFGWQRIEHDLRYEMTAELLDVVNRLWSETENFSYEARLNPWKLANAWITPKPRFGRPILVNATGSEAGIDFAATHSDLIFITSPGGPNLIEAFATLPDHIARIKARGAAQGKQIRTIINPVVIFGETEAEAWDRAHLIAGSKPDPAERKAVGFNQFDSDAHAWRGASDPRFRKGLGLGGNIEVIGTPEQVAEAFIRLHAMGIDGVHLSLYDFGPDLDYFGKRVLPLLQEAGLRV